VEHHKEFQHLMVIGEIAKKKVKISELEAPYT
jgi:hypothetical protein